MRIVEGSVMRVTCPTCQAGHSVDDRNTSPRVTCPGCGADYIVVIPLRPGRREYREAYTVLAPAGPVNCMAKTEPFGRPCHIEPGHDGAHWDGFFNSRPGVTR